MPLIRSGAPSAIHSNISDMIRAGHPRAQAIAAALRTADEYGKPRAAGGSSGAPVAPTYETSSTVSPSGSAAMGIQPSGLMAVPQIGPYTIDTSTGALPVSTQAALASFAMRGLPPTSSVPGYAAPVATPAPVAPTDYGSIGNPGQGSRAGGRIVRRANGGGAPIEGLASAMTRSAFRSIDHPSGLVHGFGAGRTDTVPLSVAAGSHVIPADVIAGLGQGNTLSGAHAMGMAMRAGPGGISLPSGPHKTMALPHPPRGFAEGGEPEFEGHAIKVAKGGCPGGVKCIVAGGEWIMAPHEVQAVKPYKGKTGHEAVDAWIVDRRALDVKKLKGLPGPVGMKK